MSTPGFALLATIPSSGWFWIPSLVAAFAVALSTWTLHRAKAGQQRLRSELQLHREQVDRLDNTLREEQSKRQTLLNGMTEGVLLIDGAGRVEFMNLALRRLLGIRNDIVGQTLSQALGRPELADLVARVAAEGQVLGTDLEIAEGAPRSLQVNGSRFLTRDGRPQGTILVFHDVTRIQHLEKARKEFVANVSHELRTPLSLIKGFVETLIDGAAQDPAVATRFLQSIQKHADRLAFLIEDLLTLSRLESGRMLMNLQPVAVAETVNRVFEDLSSRASERSVELQNQVDPSLIARADPERLQQVLFNLVENAIKYGKAKGRVLVAAHQLPEGRVEMHVQDNGPGIPPEARERVFERFYRVDRARSRETGGTGLGLAIVKHIIQSHGGEVWVQSEGGKGATFHFTLPQAH